MKKAISILILFLLVACNSEQTNNVKPETKAKQEVKENKLWTLDTDQSHVYWTGYREGVKKGVDGAFKSFEITGVKPNADMLKILKNARIKISVFSAFTENEKFDKTLIEYLFGKMMDTNEINARVESIDPNNSAILLNINMNNHEKVVKMFYKIDKENAKISMEGQIDLIKDFDAKEPLYFLQTACEELQNKKEACKIRPDVGIKAVLKFKPAN